MYKYKLPVVGIVPNLQAATVPRMNYKESFGGASSSEEEPSSSEEYTNGASSSEEPSSLEPTPNQEILLKNLYAYERKNMDGPLYGNLMSMFPKGSNKQLQNLKNNDILLQRMYDASNSAMI
jgi:hypothetical protein